MPSGVRQVSESGSAPFSSLDARARQSSSVGFSEGSLTPSQPRERRRRPGSPAPRRIRSTRRGRAKTCGVADDRTTTAETTDPGPARADRPGRARPDRRTLAVDAAVLIGLAGVAITRPLLDLFGNNPTFFVAGNYGRRQIVMFALVVGFVPGAVAVA